MWEKQKPWSGLAPDPVHPHRWFQPWDWPSEGLSASPDCLLELAVLPWGSPGPSLGLGFNCLVAETISDVPPDSASLIL